MSNVISVEVIAAKILLIRGKRVMLDRDIAKLYEVDTSQLTRQVRRNIDRFPEDCVPRTYTERRFDLSSMVLCER
ncbi:MAG: hypothetical protein COV71_03420 [Candidatus Omnitrophica bacterium CG11_big_fil_rev_8_21_14_0_20_41_12]|nr:MAG: hypothetical protein COV71_03420 [Candidatus Omnitrophica bacterium CG11_big_fil_rev_8_21_14_0_20_41_12]